MRKISTLLLFSLLSIGCFGNNRTEQELLALAKQALSQSASRVKKAFGTKDNPTSEIKKYQSLDMLNVYGYDDGGFVVICKDDAQEPILAIAEEKYTQGQMPCGFEWWLNTANAKLKELNRAHLAYTPVKVARASANFIKTSWNQGTPYNTLCPSIGGEAAPTGCIATAMAQIMYYYQYPVCGKGKGTYYVTTYKDNSDTKGTTKQYSVNINSTYAWSKMKKTYGLVTTDEDNAVATLMADAGAASKMNYSADGSGTSDWYAAKGFGDNFRYDSLAIEHKSRFLYTDEEWMDMIAEELQTKTPILYCGVDVQDGGHAFVLDGIQEDGKVHVNWGWGGTANGWYAIDLLKPVYSGGSLTSGDGFNYNQSMVIGFKPQETPEASEINSSCWATSGYGFSIVDNNLHVGLLDAYNYAHRIFEGTVDVVIENIEDNNKRYTDNIYESSANIPYIPMASGFTLSSNGEKTDYNLSNDIGAIAPGKYYVYLGSKSNSESEYQCMRGEGGKIMYTLTVNNNGEMAIVQNTSTAIAQVANSSSQSSPYTYIYNMQGQEIYKAPTVSFRLSDVPAHGVLIVKQGNAVKKMVK